MYKFKIEARNTVGYSLESNEVYIRLAAVPDIPTNMVTTIYDDDVLIGWDP
jgi:hypothetical protein